MERYSREDLGYQFGVAWVSGVSGGGGGGGGKKQKGKTATLHRFDLSLKSALR